MKPWTEENLACGTRSLFFIRGATWVPAFSSESARCLLDYVSREGNTSSGKSYKPGEVLSCPSEAVFP